MPWLDLLCRWRSRVTDLVVVRVLCDDMWQEDREPVFLKFTHNHLWTTLRTARIKWENNMGNEQKQMYFCHKYNLYSHLFQFYSHCFFFWNSRLMLQRCSYLRQLLTFERCRTVGQCQLRVRRAFRMATTLTVAAFPVIPEYLLSSPTLLQSKLVYGKFISLLLLDLFKPFVFLKLAVAIKCLREMYGIILLVVGVGEHSDILNW